LQDFHKAHRLVSHCRQRCNFIVGSPQDSKIFRCECPPRVNLFIVERVFASKVGIRSANPPYGNVRAQLKREDSVIGGNDLLIAAFELSAMVGSTVSTQWTSVSNLIGICIGVEDFLALFAVDIRDE
jgi:hypothetical protein